MMVTGNTGFFPPNAYNHRLPARWATIMRWVALFYCWCGRSMVADGLKIIESARNWAVGRYG